MYMKKFLLTILSGTIMMMSTTVLLKMSMAILIR